MTFPTSPTVGQTFVNESRTWTYTGSGPAAGWEITLRSGPNTMGVNIAPHFNGTLVDGMNMVVGGKVHAHRIDTLKSTGSSIPQLYFHATESVGNLGGGNKWSAPVLFNHVSTGGANRALNISIKDTSTAGALNVTGIEVDIESPPDRGGDTSGIYVVQSGGGNGVSIYHNSTTFPNNGFALEVAALDNSTPVLISTGDGSSGSRGIFMSMRGSNDIGLLVIPSADTNLTRRAIQVVNADNSAEKFYVGLNGNTYCAGNMTVVGKINGRFSSIATIAALKALSVTGLVTGSDVTVQGYYAAGDRAGVRTCIYDSTSVATDNGGTVIQPTSGVGRWLFPLVGRVNVFTFGAKGDGATDDLAAFNAAMAASPAIYAPAATYNFSGVLQMPSDGSAIYGDGMGKTFLNWPTNLAGDLIHSGTPSSYRRFLTLDGFTIRSGATQTAGAAIHWQWVTDSSIRNVEFGNSIDTVRLYKGLWWDVVDTVYLDTFSCHCLNDGVTINGAVGVGWPKAAGFINHGRIIGGTVGLRIAGAFGGLSVDQVDIIAMATGAIIDQSVSAEQNREIFFGSGVSIDSCSVQGIYINEAFTNGHLSLTGTWIASSGIGLRVGSASGASRISVTGGDVFNNQGDGIKNESTTSAVNVTGGFIRNNGLGGTGWGINNSGASALVKETGVSYISNASGNTTGI